MGENVHLFRCSYKEFTMKRMFTQYMQVFAVVIGIATLLGGCLLGNVEVETSYGKVAGITDANL